MQKKFAIAFLICTTLFSHSFALEKKSPKLTKDEILNFLDNKVDERVGNKLDKNSYANVKKHLAEKLKKFKVTGVATTVDPNIALIYDSQNPSFEMTFKNEKGEVKTRKYESNIVSLGYKFQFDLKVDFIFFTDTDLNFYETKNEIRLDTGIDYKCLLFNYSYAKFTNAPGGMVIVGIPIWSLLSSINFIAGEKSMAEAFAEGYNNGLKKSGLPEAFDMKKVRTQVLYNFMLEFLQFSVITSGYIRPVS